MFVPPTGANTKVFALCCCTIIPIFQQEKGQGMRDRNVITHHIWYDICCCGPRAHHSRKLYGSILDKHIRNIIDTYFMSLPSEGLSLCITPLNMVEMLVG